MKVLVIGYVWPEPNSSAAGSRMMQLLETFVNQQWQVDFASPAQHSDHQADLATLDINSHAIELNCDSFDRFIQDLAPQIVIFDRFMMEEQFGWRVEKNVPDALRVLNTEDLHSLRDARHQAVKQERPFRDEDLHTELAVREIAAIFRSDLTLMISAVETELLQQRFHVPKRQLMTLPFMLASISDSSYKARLAYDQRHHFISIGNFRHAPNWDAVLQLKQHIWPAIHRQLPNTQLHIYGAYPPPKATQLHNPKQGFFVKGWAEDAKSVIQQARVLLAPLRFGAGLKGKLVEAMQVGTPSITTPIGAEGIADSESWSGAVCFNTQAFIHEAIRFYQEEVLWLKAQATGDRLIQSNFSKEVHQERLIQRLINQYEDRYVIRKQSFFNQMLRHHSLKSTQYMSQWIEIKNKTVTD